VAEFLAQARTYAESDGERNTLTFRPMRGYGGDSDKFLLFAKYLSREDYEHHAKVNPALHAYLKSGCGTTSRLEYFEEVAAVLDGMDLTAAT